MHADPRELHDTRAPRHRLLPLTHAQTAMWIRWRYAEQSSAYNNPLLFELIGPVDVERLAAAFSALVDRHDALRARFVEVCGTPWQETMPRGEPALHFHDLSTLDGPLRERRKDELLDAALKAPFDLERDLVYRFALLRLEAGHHWLVMNIHHICVDGASAALLMEEITADYDGGVSLPAPPGIADFLDVETRRSESFAEAERFWRKELDEAPPRIDFEAIRRTDADTSGASSGRFVFHLEASGRRAATRLARQTGATLFTVLAAAFSVLLWRYTGQTRLSLVHPVTVRPRGFKRLFGCLINYLPFSFTLDRGMSVAALIRGVVEARRRCRPHEDFPHLELARLARQNGQEFNVSITAANLAIGQFRLRGLDVRPHLILDVEAKEDLGLLFDAEGDNLVLILEYRRCVFRDEAIQAMAADLLHLLIGMTAGSDRRIEDLALAGDQSFSARYAAPVRTAPDNDLFPLLDERLASAGDQVLAEGDGFRFSAHALRRLTQGAADLLLKRGVRRGDRVAVELSRSPRLLPCILGLWKIGASYVPLAPELPPARKRFILHDSSPSLVLTDRDIGAMVERDPVGPCEPCHVDEVAYLIYTSGSTGAPKGVEVTRSNLGSFLRAMEDLLPIRAGNRLLAVTTIGFDISLLELFLPMMANATVVVCPGDQVRDAYALPSLLENERIHLLQATPSFFRMLFAAGWRGKRDLVALSGGEPLEAGTADALLRGCRELWNLYGPTETTVWSTAARIEDASAVHLGAPIPGTSVDVLGPAGKPVPRHGRGEIYIRGPGVARGYRGRPELTAERFVELPGRGRAYKTGDVAERMGDDSIRYVGRVDEQVKVRGFRIEPGEIEHRLETLPGVKKSVVLPFTGRSGERALVAFVEPQGAPRGEQDIRTDLAEFLPEYMIPSNVRFVDAWPLGTSGKINRHALESSLTEVSPRAEREATSKGGSADSAESRDQAIARIYAEVLGAVPADPALSLFELGGNSLDGTRILARLRDELSIALPFKSFMTDSSLAGAIRLAQASERPAPAPDPHTAEGHFPLPAGSSRVLVSDQMLGRNHQNTLGRLFLIEGHLDIERLRQAVAAARAEFLLDRFCLEAGPPARAVAREAGEARFWNELELDLPEVEVFPLCLAWLESPLNPTSGQLCKCLLVTSGGPRHFLALAVHHAGLDGETCLRFLHALSAHYACAPPPEGFGVAETSAFAADEARRTWAERDAALRHFRQRLEGYDYFELGTELASYDPNANRTVVIDLAPAGAEALTSRLRTLGVGSFAYAVALLARALADYKGVDDICLGTVHTLRGPAAREGVFGNLTNLLPVHLRGASQGNIEVLAAGVQTQLAADRDFVFFPFQVLLDAFPECRRSGRPPMFSVLAVEDLVGEGALSLGPGTTIRVLESGFTTNLYDLTLRVPASDGWQLCLDYNFTRLDAGTVRELARAIESAVAWAGDTKVREDTQRSPCAAMPVAASGAATVESAEIVALLDEVLGTTGGDYDMGFLAVGGNSILATRVVALLRERLRIEARAYDILGAQSLRQLVQSLLPSAEGAPDRRTARPAEQAIFFLHGVARCKAAYNLPIALRFESPLLLERLRLALDAVIASEPVLRSRFEQTADGVMKIIRPPEPVHIEEHGRIPETAFAELAEAIVQRPFDLARDPLIRVHHASLGDRGDLVIFAIHHIIADGVSCGNFLRRLAQRYGGVPGEPRSTAEEPETDAATRRSRLEQLLAEFPIRDLRAALPYARSFPQVRTLEGDVYEVRLGPAQRGALGELSRQRGLPSSALVLAGVLFVLHHASRERRINVGVATMNRTAANREALGLYTNTVVLPATLDPDEPVGSALDRIAGELFSLCRYSDVPFQDVVTRLVEHPDLGVTPLFQVFYNYIDRAMYALPQDGFRVTEIPLRPVGAKFELSFEVHDFGDRLSIFLEFSTDVYDRPMVLAMGELLRRTLQSLGHASERSLGGLLRAVR